MLVGSYFFSYPDVIAADMTLTGKQPVAQIVARSTGKISRIYVADGQTVSAYTLLAIIENPASAEDMHRLEQLMERYPNQPDSENSNRAIERESAGFGAGADGERNRSDADLSQCI